MSHGNVGLDTEAGPLTEGSKARIQLEADFLNGIALNLLAIGVLGPLAAWIYTNQFVQSQALLAVGFSILCFFGSFALHWVASIRLEGIDK